MGYYKEIVKIANYLNQKYAAPAAPTTTAPSPIGSDFSRIIIKNFQDVLIRIFHMLSANYNTLAKYSTLADKEYLTRIKQALDSVEQVQTATGNISQTLTLSRALAVIGVLSESLPKVEGESQVVNSLRQTLKQLNFPETKAALNSASPNLGNISNVLDDLKRIENSLKNTVSSQVLRAKQQVEKAKAPTEPGGKPFARVLTPEEEELSQKMYGGSDLGQRF